MLSQIKEGGVTPPSLFAAGSSLFAVGVTIRINICCTYSSSSSIHADIYRAVAEADLVLHQGELRALLRVASGSGAPREFLPEQPLQEVAKLFPAPRLHLLTCSSEQALGFRVWGVGFRV